MRVVRVMLVALAAIGLQRAAAAQVEVGAEVTRDRAVWHFDAPSSYDTAALVPHFFEQEYTLDNVWVRGAARYRAGVDWHTEAAVTPVREARATDYDTFFNPGGVVWVAGTTGNANLHSVRLSQAMELGAWHGLAFEGGYRVRIDRADFLAGDKTDVRNGVLVARTTVFTREYTTGQLHEVFVRAVHERAISGRWTLRARAELTPAAVNRLSIRLPDKYPGRTLLYRTTNAVMGGRLELTGGSPSWPVTLHIAADRSLNYSATQWVRRGGVATGIALGRAW
ncbi:MAG: hypothetical protein AB7H96_12970 [Vicinamibacterales bacterium]